MKVGSITTDIIKNGLVFNMDAANRASTIPSTSTDKTFNTIDTSISGTFAADAQYDSSTTPPSFAFDGTGDSIDIGSPTIIQNLTSQIAIGFWIKASRTFSTNYYTPISKGEYASVGSQWSVKVNTANARNSSGGSFSTFSAANAIDGRENLNFPTPVDDNQWHYMVFINDSTDLKIYLDGQIEATGAGQGSTLYNGNSTLRLGKLTSSNVGLLNGNLGLVHIYNRALSASEVLHNYNALKGRFGL